MKRWRRRPPPPPPPAAAALREKENPEKRGAGSGGPQKRTWQKQRVFLLMGEARKGREIS